MARCCPCQEPNNRRPPEPTVAAADHLQVSRQHGLFNHHGIDLGDGTVAHYLEGREILRSSLDDFRQGQPLSVIDHADASPDGVTLRRAMSRIGEQNYNLLFNNCEHFAPGAKPAATAAARSTRFWNGPATGAD